MGTCHVTSNPNTSNDAKNGSFVKNIDDDPSS